MKAVERKPVPIYEIICFECKSRIQYKASEVSLHHITCPVCGVSLWADTVHPVKMDEADADIELRWIPVTERLPEQEGHYLVWFGGKFPIEIGHYINDEGDRWFCCDWNGPENVVAWMPLPEPYKEDEQND